jgi:hypothetical protein
MAGELGDLDKIKRVVKLDAFAHPLMIRTLGTQGQVIRPLSIADTVLDASPVGRHGRGAG